MTLLKMTDIDLSRKRVLIRADLNVPIAHGQVTNDARIKAVIPTIVRALQAGAAVIIMSHRGRPQEGVFAQGFSLTAVADDLAKKLASPVRFYQDWLDKPIEVASGEVVLLENVRFCVGEKANDDGLARKIAALCDVFVMDAFGVAHRAHASTYGAAKYAPIACAGPLLLYELATLRKAMHQPQAPVLAIVGGAKVSTKLTILEQLIEQVDQLIVGGGILNTFIAAHGFSVGQSLYEKDLIETAKKLLVLAHKHGADIPMPSDVVVTQEISPKASALVKSIDAVAAEDKIVDIGPETAKQWASCINKAKTIIWNGPIGVFELDQFAQGTKTIANAVATSAAFSLVGGGDTLAAIDKFGVRDEISYVSTGGGAFLELIEGRKLAAVEALEARMAA
ncbi:MAG: phosphoglycerate kinase [Gammaproteobacteria bacterium]